MQIFHKLKEVGIQTSQAIKKLAKPRPQKGTWKQKLAAENEVHRLMKGVKVDMLPYEEIAPAKPVPKVYGALVESVMPKHPSPDEFVFTKEERSGQPRPEQDTLTPPPRTSNPPKEGTFYPQSHPWNLQEDDRYWAGYSYIQEYQLVRVKLDENNMKSLRSPPEMEPRMDEDRYIPNVIPESIHMPTGVPLGVHIEGDARRLVTIACVHTLASLSYASDFSEILYHSIVLAKLAWGIKGEIDRLNYLGGLKTNDRSPKKNNGKDGSFSLAGTVVDGEGSGHFGPAVQANTEAASCHIATLLQTLARLFELVMPKCISKLEWELFNFMCMINNVYSFGGLGPGGTSCQFNCSSLKNGLKGIGAFGSWHTDISDDLMTYTLFILLFNAGPDADPGIFFFARYGIYIRELGVWIVFACFKGGDFHTGSSIRENSTRRDQWVADLDAAWNMAGPENRMGFVIYSTSAATERSANISVTPATHFGNGGTIPVHRKDYPTFGADGQVVMSGLHNLQNRSARELLRAFYMGLELCNMQTSLDIDELLASITYTNSKGDVKSLDKLPLHPIKDKERIDKLRSHYQAYRWDCESMSFLVRRADYRKQRDHTKAWEKDIAAVLAFREERYLEGVTIGMRAIRPGAFVNKKVVAIRKHINAQQEACYIVQGSDTKEIQVPFDTFPTELLPIVRDGIGTPLEPIPEQPEPEEEEAPSTPNCSPPSPSSTLVDASPHAPEDPNMEVDNGDVEQPEVEVPSTSQKRKRSPDDDGDEEDQPLHRRTRQRKSKSTPKPTPAAPVKQTKTRPTRQPLSEEVERDRKNGDYHVKAITNHRWVDGDIHYHVLWEHFKGGDWLPIENLANCPDIFRQYKLTTGLAIRTHSISPQIFRALENRIWTARNLETSLQRIDNLFSPKVLADDLEGFRAARPLTTKGLLQTSTTDIIKSFLRLNRHLFMVEATAKVGDLSSLNQGLLHLSRVAAASREQGKGRNKDFMLDLSMRLHTWDQARTYIVLYEWFKDHSKPLAKAAVTMYRDTRYAAMSEACPELADVVNHIVWYTFDRWVAKRNRDALTKNPRAREHETVLEFDERVEFGPRPNFIDLKIIPNSLYNLVQSPSNSRPITVNLELAHENVPRDQTRDLFWSQCEHLFAEAIYAGIIFPYFKDNLHSEEDNTAAAKAIAREEDAAGKGNSTIAATSSQVPVRNKGAQKPKANHEPQPAKIAKTPKAVKDSIIARGAILAALAQACGTSAIFACTAAKVILNSPCTLFAGKISRDERFAKDLLSRKDPALLQFISWLDGRVPLEVKSLAKDLGQEVHDTITWLVYAQSSPTGSGSASDTYVPSELVSRPKQYHNFSHLTADHIINPARSISLRPAALIIREAYLNLRNEIGNDVLHRILIGVNGGSSNSTKFTPDQTNPIRKSLEMATMLMEHIPPHRVTSPAGISNLLSFMGTGQGCQTRAFLQVLAQHSKGGFWRETLEEMCMLFTDALNQELILVDYKISTETNELVEVTTRVKDSHTISDPSVFGQPSNHLRLQPVVQGQLMTILEKFSPYYDQRRQAEWQAFLGDMAGKDPQTYEGRKRTWAEAQAFLEKLHVVGFYSGLTALQFCNNLYFYGIITPPSPLELGVWISYNPKLGAKRGLEALGFALPDHCPLPNIVAAFECVYQYLDERITDPAIRTAMDFNPIFVEHLLCKVARYAKRLELQYRDPKDWAQFMQRSATNTIAPLPFEEVAISREQLDAVVEKVKAVGVGRL